MNQFERHDASRSMFRTSQNYIKALIDGDRDAITRTEREMLDLDLEVTFDGDVDRLADEGVQIAWNISEYYRSAFLIGVSPRNAMMVKVTQEKRDACFEFAKSVGVHLRLTNVPPDLKAIRDQDVQDVSEVHHAS